MPFLVPRLLHSRVYFLYNTSTAGNKHWSEKAPGTRGEYFLQGSKFDPSEVLKRKGSDFLHLTPCAMVYKPQPQTTIGLQFSTLFLLSRCVNVPCISSAPQGRGQTPARQRRQWQKRGRQKEDETLDTRTQRWQHWARWHSTPWSSGQERQFRLDWKRLAYDTI